MFVMAAVANHVPGIVQQSTGFEKNASLRRQPVNGLQLVEELKAQFADVFRMLLIVFEPAREAARSDEQLAGGAVVAMRLCTGKSLVRDFLEKPFANPDTRNGKDAQVQIARQSDKRNGGDAHDVRAVAADTVGLHALAHVALENVWQTLAQERKLDRLEAMLAGTWGNFGESFRVSAEGDGNPVVQVGPWRKFGFQKGADILANLFAFCRLDDAGEIESGHEANGAYGQLRALLDGVIAKDADL
jgi:hypothetical protein